MAEYQRRRRELEQKKQALATQVQQLDTQVDRRAEVTGLMTSIEAFCQRIRKGVATATFAQKRTLVELVIDRVLVTNGEVEIRYVFPTHPRSEKTRFCHLRKDYFNDVIEIALRPHKEFGGQDPLFLEFTHGGMRGGAAVARHVSP